MVTLLRLLQIVVVLLTVPMAAIGGMSMFSGGGQTPAFQEVGGQMVMVSIFIPIPAVIVAEIIYRLMKHIDRIPQVNIIPVLIVLIPLVIWIWLIVRLQMATGFFGG